MVKKAIDNNGNEVEVADDTPVDNRNGVDYLLSATEQAKYDQDLQSSEDDFFSDLKKKRKKELKEEEKKRLDDNVSNTEQQQVIVDVLDEVINSGGIPDSPNIDKMRKNNKNSHAIKDKSKKIEQEINTMDVEKLKSYDISDDSHWV